MGRLSAGGSLPAGKPFSPNAASEANRPPVDAIAPSWPPLPCLPATAAGGRFEVTEQTQELPPWKRL
jgi:hypothetical protein